MAVSNYENVFGEPATEHDLNHIFDVLNENNDDRIQFRQFVTHSENCGFKPGREQIRQVFDHISSLAGSNVINKHAWINAINIAHTNPLTQKCYRCILRGGQYDPQHNRSERHIDEINKNLKDISAEWRVRIQCMESLARQLCKEKLSPDKFHSIFRLNHIGLTKQARDRRSNVMRVACETEAKIILRWKSQFSKYGTALIEYMYELIRLKIHVNNMMGRNVLMCLVKNCPDNKKLRFLELLGKEANNSKYQNLKKDCFDILVVYFQHQTKSLKQESSFWDLTMQITKKGVQDVDQVRNAAMNLLALIQVERYDLADPIIKKMNDHLRRRYQEQFQISRGGGNPSVRAFTRKNRKQRDQNEYKSNAQRGGNYGAYQPGKKDQYVSIAGNDHVRKHTWSTTDLINGFAQMQQKQKASAAQKQERKKKEKKAKQKAKFPEAPPGEFFNPFGESVTNSDILYAFQFVDSKNDRKITIDELISACDRLDVDAPEKIFSYLDIGGNDCVDFNDWKQALSERHPKLMNFWYRVLSGRSLEESPKPSDYDLDDAQQILSNTQNDAWSRILALHSITRKMCMKLTQDKFHKLFKRAVSNVLLNLYDRKSFVTRETCICLGKIMIARRAQFVKFAVRTLEALYEIIHLNDEKTHISAHQTAKVLIRFIPDSKKFPIFKIVYSGACDKQFIATRTSSFEYVNHILARMVQVDQDRSDRFWNYMEKCLDSGLCDSDQSVRDAAYSALAKTEILRKDLASEYIKVFKKVQKEKYTAIKKYVLAHIQEEDFGSEGPGLLIALGGHSYDAANNSLNRQGSGGPGGDQNTAADWKLLGIDSPNANEGSNTATTSTKRSKKTSKLKTKGAESPRDKARIKSKSPKPPSRPRFGDSTSAKSNKSTRRTPSTSSNGSKSKSKHKTKLSTNSLTTDDYTPPSRNKKNKSRSNVKTIQRPKTARSSTEKKKKGGSDALRKESKKKKKGKKSVELTLAKPKKMSMQDQARQALCVTAHKSLVQVFIEKTEDLTGAITFQQFRQCLDGLGLEVGKGDALRAFQELDDDQEEELDMEQFGHAVHVAYPEFELLWKQLGRSKYRYYATLENLMSWEEIRAVLLDKRTFWKDKTRAMRSACAMVCDAKTKDADVTNWIKKGIDAFIVALRSAHVCVVREACVTVATMAKERTVCMKGVVGKLLKTCWELLDVKRALIKFSAGQCLKIVIKYVPDDTDNKYLKTLIQGTMLQDFTSVRSSCYECIIVLILKSAKPNVKMGTDFWKRIKQIIVDGSQSEDEEVKEHVYHCLYAVEKASPKKHERILGAMDAKSTMEYKLVCSQDDGYLAFDDAASMMSFKTADGQRSPSVDGDDVDSDEAVAPPPPMVDVEGTVNGSSTIPQSKPRQDPPGQWAGAKVSDEDEKEQPVPPSNRALPPVMKKNSKSQLGAPPTAAASVALSTPIPSNDALPIEYEERTKEIEEAYHKLDVNSAGSLDRFKAMKFLKELMDVNMRNADMILSGLDQKRSGKFTLEMLQKWAYAHSPEMEPNPLLYHEAESKGWMALRKDAIEKRIQLYSSLLQLEKSDKNYIMAYELDFKICILNYLLRQC